MSHNNEDYEDDYEDGYGERVQRVPSKSDTKVSIKNGRTTVTTGATSRNTDHLQNMKISNDEYLCRSKSTSQKPSQQSSFDQLASTTT